MDSSLFLQGALELKMWKVPFPEPPLLPPFWILRVAFVFGSNPLNNCLIAAFGLAEEAACMLDPITVFCQNQDT